MSHADDRSQTMGQPHTPKVQTTSPKNGKNGLLWVRWSAIWANPGTRQTRPPTTATFPRNTTDKSPPQQHDVSILRLIGHVVLLGSHLACLGTPFSSARGPAIPSLGNPAHVRNRRPTCETAGSHAGRVGTQVTVAHSQSMTDHGAATHRPATQHSQERGKHHHLQQQLSRATQPTSHHPSNTIYPSSKLAPPPTTPTFRTNKPKSHHKTNTFCPITLVSYNPNPEPSGSTHMESTAGSTSTPHPEPAQAAQATTKPRDSKGIPGQGAETAGFEPARGYAPLPP